MLSWIFLHLGKPDEIYRLFLHGNGKHCLQLGIPGMTGVGRKCEYILLGGNGKLCCKGDVQGINLNVLNVL
jgi:hypothetical protein